MTVGKAYGLSFENLSKRSLQRRVLGRILRNASQRHGGREYRVLCLPGATCWDVDFFLAFPVVTSIVALDRDPDVAAVIRARYKGNERVDVVECTSTEYFQTAQAPFSLIYLDYFSNFNHAVEWDLRLVFRRRLLEEKGKYVINILGAREVESDQARHMALFENLDDRHPCGERWDDLSPERRRCIAYNALVAGYRYTPIRPTVQQGHPDRLYAMTTAPAWHKYKTASAYMYTAHFTLNSYSRKRGGGAIELAMDCWFARGKHEPREVIATHLAALTKSKAGHDRSYDDYYKAAIRSFYDKHHYSPTPKDIGKQYVHGWRGLVRAAGLCPRVGATRDEIVAEVERIGAREGFVTWELLQKAKISRRPLFASGRKSAKDLCDSLGIPCDVRAEPQRESFRLKGERIKEWVRFLETGQPKSKHPWYSWAQTGGLLDYGQALAAMRRYDKVAQTGALGPTDAAQNPHSQTHSHGCAKS